MTTNTSTMPEIVRNRKVTGQATYSFPSKPLPHGIQFIFKKFDYNKFVNSLNKGETVTSTNAEDPKRIKKFGLNPNVDPAVPSEFTSIELPFPTQLVDANGIKNEAFERSFLFERLTGTIAQGNIGSSAASIAKDILGAIRGVGSGSTQEALEGVLKENNIGSMFGNVGAAANYLSRSILPGDLGKQFSQAGGVIANPQQSLAFTGVDLKSFTFSWDLFPSNKADSARIRDIVQVLKNRALPEVQSVSEVVGLNRAFLKYPAVVVVNLLGVDESHFVKFKPAMLTQVNVDYGTGGMVTILKGGKPAAVTLTLAFTELNIHTAEDYPDPTVNSANQEPQAESDGTPKVIST